MLVALLATVINLGIFTLASTVAIAVTQAIVNVIFKALEFKRRGEIVQAGPIKEGLPFSAVWATVLPVWVARVALQTAGKIKGDTLGIHWPEVCDTFCQYHKHPSNVFWHVVTSTLMLLGWLSAADTLLFPGISYPLAASYIGMLAFVLPRSELTKSALAMALLVLVCRTLEMGVVAGVILYVVGTVVTDISHSMYEPSYMSTYIEMTSMDLLFNYTEHIFLLLPLVLASASRLM